MHEEPMKVSKGLRAAPYPPNIVTFSINYLETDQFGMTPLFTERDVSMLWQSYFVRHGFIPTTTTTTISSNKQIFATVCYPQLAGLF